MSSLDDMFFSLVNSTSQWGIDWYEGITPDELKDGVGDYKVQFKSSYDEALIAYNQNLADYKNISRSSSDAEVEEIISQTYDTVLLISDSIKNAINYIDYVNNMLEQKDYTTPSKLTADKSNLSSYTGVTNNHLVNLLSINTNIEDYKNAFLSNDLDIQSSELTVRQKENALEDAKAEMSDYYVYAPFAGVIASVDIQKGEYSSGVIGSIITDQKVVTLSMNEVDVASLELGQEAVITFDAIEDLSVVGSVAEIDVMGDVSQGVVSYDVKLVFNSDDQRIKSGMSVSADITTEHKEEVLVLPASAVKSNDDTYYVEILIGGFNRGDQAAEQGEEISVMETEKVEVEIGITDDINIEIISGLSEGDRVLEKSLSVEEIGESIKEKSSSGSLIGGNTRVPGMGPGMR